MPDLDSPPQRPARSYARRARVAAASIAWGAAGSWGLTNLLWLLGKPYHPLVLPCFAPVEGFDRLLVVVLALGVLALALLSIQCWQAAPRPWSVPVFLGCLATLAIGGLLTPEGRNAVQATLLAAVLGLAEVLARRPPRHRLTAACMLAIGLSMYMFVCTVEAIASC